MNLNMRTMLPALCGLLLAAVQPAHAEGELMVLPATTKLFNAHEQKVTVKNMGDAPLYLNVSVRKVTNPGMTPEKKVDLGDLDMSRSSSGAVSHHSASVSVSCVPLVATAHAG